MAVESAGPHCKKLHRRRNRVTTFFESGRFSPHSRRRLPLAFSSLRSRVSQQSIPSVFELFVSVNLLGIEKPEPKRAEEKEKDRKQSTKEESEQPLGG
jgi:hypothetical protein